MSNNIEQFHFSGMANLVTVTYKFGVSKIDLSNATTTEQGKISVKQINDLIKTIGFKGFTKWSSEGGWFDTQKGEFIEEEAAVLSLDLFPNIMPNWYELALRLKQGLQEMLSESEIWMTMFPCVRVLTDTSNDWDEFGGNTFSEEEKIAMYEAYKRQERFHFPDMTKGKTESLIDAIAAEEIQLSAEIYVEDGEDKEN